MTTWTIPSRPANTPFTGRTPVSTNFTISRDDVFEFTGLLIDSTTAFLIDPTTLFITDPLYMGTRYNSRTPI